MADRIQVRRDTAANWASVNPVLSQGEPGLDLTNGVLKFGNGVDAWADLTGISGVGGAGQDGADGREIELQSDGTNIQWRYAGDVGWTNLVLLADLQGPAGVNGSDGADGAPGVDGADGADGREIVLQTSLTHVQWKYVDDVSWTNLIALTAITGPAGNDGADGSNGLDGAAGANGADGSDGREIELQTSATHIQWRYVGDPAWTNLVLLTDIQGPAGNDGADGAAGTPGLDGADGDSAYDIAVANGFVGDETAWLASLVGPAGADGADGTNGIDGSNGLDGADGDSAYNIAVANGFVGNEAAWLASLAGADGADGDTHVPDPTAEPDNRWLKTASGALVFADPPSGSGISWTLISNNTYSESASLSISGFSTYDEVEFYIVGKSTHTLGAQSDLLVQCNSDTGSNYEWVTFGRRGASNMITNSASDTAIQADLAIATSQTNSFYHSEVFIRYRKLAPTGAYRVLYGHVSGFTANSVVDSDFGGVWKDTSALTSLQVSLGNGNWADGVRVMILGRNWGA